MKKKFKLCLWALLGILAGPRAGFAPPAFSFDPRTDLSGKILTPNGDGANDVLFFRFNNPFDSSVTLRIFNIEGNKVAAYSSISGQAQFNWDGKSESGESVRSGIYIYQLESEGQIFNGAIVVAR